MAGGRWASSDRRLRLPADWPARRRAVLERDQYRCHVCGGAGADGVDHLRAGDDHALGNLAAIHHHVEPRCHVRKSSGEGGAAAQAKRRAMTTRPTEPHPAFAPMRD